MDRSFWVDIVPSRDLFVVDWPQPLVVMLMSLKNDIHPVLVEQGFQSGVTGYTRACIFTDVGWQYSIKGTLVLWLILGSWLLSTSSI